MFPKPFLKWFKYTEILKKASVQYNSQTRSVGVFTRLCAVRSKSQGSTPIGSKRFSLPSSVQKVIRVYPASCPITTDGSRSRGKVA